MDKLIILNFLLITLLGACEEPKNFTMDMPDTKPPLFQVNIGLSQPLNDQQVVFEKYVQTRMGTAAASRLYANGDFYTIYLAPNKSLKDGNISWKKTGTIAKSAINSIEKISNNSVVDFINDGPHKRSTGAIENVNWYFYFDQPIFAQTQLRQWQWGGGAPKFVKKIDKIIEESLSAD